jgi:hypothetical protein
MANDRDRAHVIRPSAPPQPRPNGRWHRLWVVPPSGEHRVIALGESVAWVWRHWLPGMGPMRFCLDSIGRECLLCRHHIGREQSGYLPVLRGDQQETMVITAGAWLRSASIQRADGALRGYTIHAMRLHARANGPLRVWVPGEHIDGRRLPTAWDVWAELDVRYGLASRDTAPGEDRDRRAAK